MAGGQDSRDDPVSWRDRLQYWSIIFGVIVALALLSVMWVYSFVMTTECSFARFVTFQCERVFR